MSKFAGFIIGAALIATAFVLLPAGVALTAAAARTSLMLIIQGGALILMQAVADLTTPKTPARDASEMTIALGEQPRVLLIGETFTPGSLVDGFDYGGKYSDDWEVLVIRLADHKCHSLTGFYVNDDYNLYQGDGLVPRYDDQLKIYFRADTTTDPLPAIVTSNGPGWTAADIGRSGCDVIVAYKADKPNDKHPGWPGGRPRFGFVVKGAFCYDPRKDSTVSGGAGTHRDNDGSTWEWSENAAICRYKWVRGVYADDDVSDPTQLLVGRGLTADEAPPENIFAAANLCDEVQGTVWPYQDLVTTQSPGANLAFSPDGTILAYWHTAGVGIEWWNVATRTRLGYANAGAMTGITPNVSLDQDGTAWFMADYIEGVSVGKYLVSIPLLGSVSKQPTTAASNFFECTRALTSIYTAYQSSAGYMFGPAHVPIADSARDFCIDDVGNEWMATQPTGASSAFTLTNLTTSTSTTLAGTARSGPTSLRMCFTAWGDLFVSTDGHFYVIDKATMTVTASGAAPWGTPTLPGQIAGGRSFWDGFSQYSLQDGSLIRTVSSMSWVAASYSEDGFDAINDAIWARTSGSGSTTLRVLFLDRHGGYRVAGPIYADQPFIDVEQMFAAATAGNIVTVEGSVELEPGQAKSVVATFTDADLLVGSKVSWNQGFLSQASGEWLNTVVPNYIEPDQRWNAHDAPVLRVNGDIVADGKARETQLTLRLVRYQPQALRIGEIARRLGRLWGRASVTLGPRFCEIEDGDWVSWQSDRHFGGAAKTFRVDAYSIDEKWQISLTLREITGEAFAADGTFSFDLAVPTTTVPPPAIGTPTAGNWALAATTLTSSGASIPALEITGTAADDDKAQTIIVEYWMSDGVTDPTINPDAIPWTMAGRYSPDTAKVDITSVTGGAVYYTAVSYVVDGIPGDRLVEGPVTVGTLAANPPTSALTASEAIAAATFVNIYSSSGAKVRNANATDDSKPVNGFAGAAIANGATGAVQGPGCKVSGLLGLTPGATYYLDTAPGAITVTPPSTSGNLVQEVGVAVSATELLFSPKQGTTL